MTLFDRYIAVDWSAANERRTGKDSIWIAERGRRGSHASRSTLRRAPKRWQLADRAHQAARAARRAHHGRLRLRLRLSARRGPRHRRQGRLARACGTPSARPITDSSENKSNRFEVAAGFNRALELAALLGPPAASPLRRSRAHAAAARLPPHRRAPPRRALRARPAAGVEAERRRLGRQPVAARHPALAPAARRVSRRRRLAVRDRLRARRCRRSLSSKSIPRCSR